MGERRKSPDVVGPAGGLFQVKCEKGRMAGYQLRLSFIPVGACRETCNSGGGLVFYASNSADFLNPVKF